MICCLCAGDLLHFHAALIWRVMMSARRGNSDRYLHRARRQKVGDVERASERARERETHTETQRHVERASEQARERHSHTETHLQTLYVYRHLHLPPSNFPPPPALTPRPLPPRFSIRARVSISCRSSEHLVVDRTVTFSTNRHGEELPPAASPGAGASEGGARRSSDTCSMNAHRCAFL